MGLTPHTMVLCECTMNRGVLLADILVCIILAQAGSTHPDSPRRPGSLESGIGPFVCFV